MPVARCPLASRRPQRPIVSQPSSSSTPQRVGASPSAVAASSLLLGGLVSPSRGSIVPSNRRVEDPTIDSYARSRGCMHRAASSEPSERDPSLSPQRLSAEMLNAPIIEEASIVSEAAMITIQGLQRPRSESCGRNSLPNVELVRSMQSRADMSRGSPSRGSPSHVSTCLVEEPGSQRLSSSNDEV